MSLAISPEWESAVAASATALRRVAGYHLPAALDQRILELGEQKELLTPEERDELFAWIAFTQDRTIETLEARAALRRLNAVCPELVATP